MINGPGANSAVPITVSESGYTGSFGESDTCAAFASITDSTPTGPSTTYTATGISSGNCTATFTDTGHQSVTINVQVTINGFVIDSHRRHSHKVSLRRSL